MHSERRFSSDGFFPLQGGRVKNGKGVGEGYEYTNDTHAHTLQKHTHTHKKKTSPNLPVGVNNLL